MSSAFLKASHENKFKIELLNFKETWKWLNNESLAVNNSINKYLNLTSYWHETGIHYGRCGSIVLLDTNEIILRSVTCKALAARFICSYCKLMGQNKMFEINILLII